jgi:hypothetical protein
MPASPSHAEALVGWAAERALALPDLLAGLALARAEHLDADGAAELTLVSAADPVVAADLPLSPEQITPDLLGEVLGVSAAATRRDEGAVFTPRASAEGLVRVALDALGHIPRQVLDPAVGGGVFLLAVVRALVERGLAADEAFARVQGHDRDPLSVQVAVAALGLWFAEQAGRVEVRSSVDQEDDVLLRAAAVPEPPVDLVVGNPPFLSQLRRATTRSSERLAALRRRYGTAAGPYTDDAALFLLAGLERLHDGGVLALIQPRSFLGAEGAGEVRRRMLDDAALVGLWEPIGRVFPVAVDVCAPVLVRGAAQPPEVRVWHEVDLGESAGTQPAEQLLGADPSVGFASSRHDGPPMVGLPPHGGRLGDHARVTAGFRDQFYGMAPCVREAEGPDDPRPRLVTSGLIDPGLDAWGRRPARIARRSWDAPVLQHDLLDPDERVGRWVAARLVPKVVVASQTKVVEATLDLVGRVIPSPPTVSVEAPATELPRMMAVLLAPATTAWLHRRAAGTGLAPDSLRVSRAHLAELPLPGDRVAWDEATELLLAICTGPDARPLGDDEPTRAFGEVMAAAHGIPSNTADEVVTWWLARLPAASLA